MGRFLAFCHGRMYDGNINQTEGIEMKSLVLYFDDHHSCVDVEYEGRVIYTQPYGFKLEARGLKVFVDVDGDFVDDLEGDVEVGSYHDTFCEFVFNDLNKEDISIKETDD